MGWVVDCCRIVLIFKFYISAECRYKIYNIIDMKKHCFSTNSRLKIFLGQSSHNNLH